VFPGFKALGCNAKKIHLRKYEVGKNERTSQTSRFPFSVNYHFNTKASIFRWGNVPFIKHKAEDDREATKNKEVLLSFKHYTFCKD
jgi:hypothetical protein